MTDLVEHLRHRGGGAASLEMEAADEIECLRSEVKLLRRRSPLKLTAVAHAARLLLQDMDNGWRPYFGNLRLKLKELDDG